jgi:hypothetical protein
MDGVISILFFLKSHGPFLLIVAVILVAFTVLSCWFWSWLSQRRVWVMGYNSICDQIPLLQKGDHVLTNPPPPSWLNPGLQTRFRQGQLACLREMQIANTREEQRIMRLKTRAVHRPGRG